MLLRHIRYFLAVAEHGNFTRAAEALHVSQPALSQQVRQLEETLGVLLFDRSGRGIHLTDAGYAYGEYVRRALRDLDAGQQAIHDVRDLSRGRLRLANTPTFTEYLVAPLIERFGSRYPGIAVTANEMTLDQIVAALGDDRIDLGIAFTNVRSAEIECHPLFDERLTLVVGRNHRFVGWGKPLSLPDLENVPLALLSRNFATRTLIDEYFQANGVSPGTMIEADSISTIVKIVRYGRMATILPDAIVRDDDALDSVELQPPLPHRTVAMLSRKGAYRSAACAAFAELLHGLTDDAALAEFIAQFV
jgi:LysR family cyn operon transcriptional activator